MRDFGDEELARAREEGVELFLDGGGVFRAPALDVGGGEDEVMLLSGEFG